MRALPQRPARRQPNTTLSLLTSMTKASVAVLMSALMSGCAFTISESDFLRSDRTVWPESSIDSTFQRTVVTVKQSDGNVSRGIRLHSPNARGTVLFFQGNGETVDREGAHRLWQFERLNVNAVILDRRGYGQTPGQPTIVLLASDALEAFDQIRSETKGPLVVHGFSLGTSIAGLVAKNRNVDALVIEGGTPSVTEYIAVHLPWYLKLVSRPKVAKELEGIGTSAALRGYTGPLLIAAGERDKDTIPELSKRLFASLDNSQKELVIVPGAGHNALTTPAGSLVYRAFLHRVAR